MSETRPEHFVTPAAAHQYWVKHAYEILVDTASHYDRVITHSDLAEEVQRRSGLWTRAGVRSWVGALLSDIARVNTVRGEPLLPALVVHKQDGQVGPGYADVLRIAGQRPIDDLVDRENHAARARLECYRAWAPDVPDDAQPRLATRAPAPRARPTHARADMAAQAPARTAQTRSSAPVTIRTRSTRSEERRGSVCPTCFMEMPLSGRCVNCEG